MTTGIEIVRNPRFVADDLDHAFGTGKDAVLQWDTAETNDALKLGLKVNNAAFSGNFIIVNKDYIGSNTALGITADPRLVVWSGDDPAVGGANEYIGLLHNRTDAVIETGAGNLVLDPAGNAVMVALAAGHPAADPGILQIWKGDAGAVIPIAGSAIVLESNGNVYLSFLAPTANDELIIFGNPTSNNRASFGWSEPNTRFQWGFVGANRLFYTANAFAFQEATTISTTAGNLTLNPAGDVSVSGKNFIHGAAFSEFSEIADPAAPAANGARLYTKDNGVGKSQLVVRFNTGAVQVLATEP